MTRTLYFVWFIGFAAAGATDPCKSYTQLNGASRQRQIVTSNITGAICDMNLTPGWYRFTGGAGVVAMSKVSKLHCGTVSPIWMDDTLPPPGTSAMKKFCFNNQDSKSTGCSWSVMSNVQNCEQFIVYKLPLPTILCPMAMCVDPTVKPCPLGQVSSNGFPPCTKIPCQPGTWSASGFEPCGHYPKVDKVTLSPPEKLRTGKYQHLCQITSSETSPDVRFKVTWSFNGHASYSQILSGRERSAYMDLAKWLGNGNTDLTCSVQAYFEPTKTHISSPITSNKYYGGIKVEPSPLTITEGKDKTVNVIMTLPLKCPNPPSAHECRLDLHVLSPKLYTRGSCTLKLTHNDWNPVTHEARTSFVLAAPVDPAVKPKQKTLMTVDWNSNNSVTFRAVASSASGLNVEVLVIDENSSLCNIGGDPHITHSFTYPGRYNLYHQGDFNLASDSGGSIGIQIETNVLYQRTHLPMISAVAVQTSDDVTIIDTHGGSRVPSITSNRKLTSQTVQSCGTNEHQISTPNGHRVNVYSGGSPKTATYVNLQVHFPGDPNTTLYHFEVCSIKNLTNGLLTLNRGVISDKVIDLFRPLPHENIFKGQLLPMPKQPTDEHYCRCTRTRPNTQLQVKCVRGKADDPMIKRTSCKVIQPTIQPPPPVPRPGEAYFKTYKPTARTWPTRSGITEAQAKAKCTTDIKSHVSPQCLTIPIDDIVASCMEDIQAADSYEYNAGAAQTFQTKCETEILSNPNNYKKTPTGELVAPEIITDQCPNLCSMQGTCVKGVCHCNSGWEWEDCSVKSGQPFQISGIQGGLLCDKSVPGNSCFNPVLNVENLGDISECSVDMIAYVQGKATQPEGLYKGTHERQGSSSVLCSFDQQIVKSDFHAKMFSIKLSPTSKTQTSQNIKYVIYDGVCQKCENDLTCFMKENACLIEKKCYKDGFVKDTELKCIPKLNMDGWTVIDETGGQIPVGK